MQKKKRQGNKFTQVEEALRRYITTPNVSTHRYYASAIIGIFHKNFAKLEITIHIKGSGNVKRKVAEPILRAIYTDEELTQEHRDALDLQAFGAERIHATRDLTLDKVKLIENTNWAILEIPAHLSKTGIAHPSIIPR